jgi:hypothetical protein
MDRSVITISRRQMMLFIGLGAAATLLEANADALLNLAVDKAV